MRKFIVTCDCGQRMQVPRTAVGKVGLCPACGQSVRITADNTAPQSGRAHSDFAGKKNSWWQGRAEPSQEAKQQFGQAVDMFYSHRYGEALAIFDLLAKQYPGNPDVERGRAQCVAAIKRPALSGAREGQRLIGNEAALDADTVKRVVLDKMLHGTRDETVLHAAELAARILGLLDPNKDGAQAGASEASPADAGGARSAQAETVKNVTMSEYDDPASASGSAEGNTGEVQDA